MQPLAIVLNSQVIIAIVTVIIIIILSVSFQFRFNKYLIFSFIVVSLIFLLNFFLYDLREITVQIFMEFLLKSFSLFIIGSFPFTTNYLKKYFYIFSIVNFIVLTPIIFFGMLDSIGYMRFGYAMLPTLLTSIFFFKDKNKILCFLLAISSFIIILIFGSRGPLIALIIFVCFILLTNKEIKLFKKMFMLLALSIGTYYLFIANILLRALDFIYYEAGFQTYSIFKLRLMFEGGLKESSSGRDYLYGKFVNKILESPIFGSGIGVTHELWDVTPHNIFIQILIESGFVGLGIALLFGVVIMFFLFKVRKVDNELFLLLVLIFSVAFGRLLVSSDMWLRQELWLFLSVTINTLLISKENMIIKLEKRYNLKF